MDITTKMSGVFIARMKDGDPMGAVLQKYLLKGMEKVGQGLERHVKTQKLSGQALKARTGNLRRAIFHKVGAVANDVIGVVGVDLAKAKYGRIQELGGVIRPKKSKHLTIPLDAAKTGNGVARFTARDVISSPGSYGYVGTFTRNNIIFGKQDGGGIVPLFALKTSVTIRAVGYLKSTVEEKMSWIKQTLMDSIAAGVKEMNGG